ncbi:hemerythrin domain-containing protein [Cellulomonas sp. GbtcB1]|uniref:hemerythrin domain-containing protein n=1 Tax=Cellulomonas sp. GbtcB1 TaxID=2824746 RepID=UPI001C305ABF|nr:hemerythrin domain-containing protein [Cellulomonas sp. GbtcB1]
MTATTDRPGCDTSDLLHIHALFRRAFGDAPGLVRGVPDGDVARMRVVAAHVREVATGLHHHHEGEDLLLWDRLEQRSPACALHVGLMRAQHADVAGLLRDLDAALPAWEAGAAAGARDEVARVLEELQALLVLHLGQEEDRILPTASSVLSQREWDHLHEHGMASVPRSRMLLQLGWILDAVPEPERAGWLRTNLPAPARLLWRTVGRRRFAAHRAQVYGVR